MRRRTLPIVAAAIAALELVASPPASALTDRELAADFACIHRHEGAWDANTGNGYFGGLQMDRPFMRRYGARLYRMRGTADRWTPAEQIRAAIRAYRERGFEPWPNTARACGLL